MDLFEDSLLELLDNVNIRSREQIQWCDFEGRPSSEAIQKPFDFILQVKSGAFKVSARDVVFSSTEVLCLRGSSSSL